MSLLPNIPIANFSTCTNMLRIAALSGRPVLMIGDPGVGKTSIARSVAKELNLPCYELLGSTLDPTDVGGLPVKHTDEQGRVFVERVPLRCLRDAADHPSVLFLDELASASAAVQAAFLRLILDRVAGDIKLHPETIIFAATNPPEQTPGGFDLTAPLMGRVAIVNFRPDEEEVIAYLRNLGNSESENASERSLSDEASIFAAIASQTPELLQINIPKVAIQGGQPWASPRQCEAMLRHRAAASQLGMDPQDDAVFNLMAGCIGVSAATTYNGVLKMITELPSVEEIAQNPKTAMLPSEKTKQIAALGLMARIAKKNYWSAYIYAERMCREIGIASHRALIPLGTNLPPPNDPLTLDGIKARTKLSSMIGGPRKSQ